VEYKIYTLGLTFVAHGKVQAFVVLLLLLLLLLVVVVIIVVDIGSGSKTAPNDT
jgi:hypothetical protein